MSDKRQTIEASIPGEVWWVIAITEHLLPPHHYTVTGEAWEAVHSPSETDKTPADIWNVPSELLLPSLWTVAIDGDAESATIRITAPLEQMNDWRQFIERIQSIARTAERHRRLRVGSLADQAIERYYRIRAAGGKTTLKDVAAQFKISHKYLRRRKVEYDRLGMWGSKKRSKATRQNKT